MPKKSKSTNPYDQPAATIKPPVKFKPPTKFLTQIPDPEDTKPYAHYCDNPDCEAPAVKQVPVSEEKFADSTRWYCAVCETAYTIGLQHADMRPRPVVISVQRGLVDAVYADKATVLDVSIADGDLQDEEDTEHQAALLKIQTLNLKQIYS